MSQGTEVRSPGGCLIFGLVWTQVDSTIPVRSFQCTSARSLNTFLSKAEFHPMFQVGPALMVTYACLSNNLPTGRHFLILISSQHHPDFFFTVLASVRLRHQGTTSQHLLLFGLRFGRIHLPPSMEMPQPKYRSPIHLLIWY